MRKGSDRLGQMQLHQVRIVQPFVGLGEQRMRLEVFGFPREDRLQVEDCRAKLLLELRRML